MYAEITRTTCAKTNIRLSYRQHDMFLSSRVVPYTMLEHMYTLLWQSSLLMKTATPSESVYNPSREYPCE